MFRVLTNTVQIAHQYLKTALQPGGVAVDATLGNGNDTAFLAQLVGETGRIYGFDIQPQAVLATRDLLVKKGFAGKFELFNTGHEKLSEYVNESVDAVVFNLGYLPGGDHRIITTPDTTVRAVASALDLLKPGGIICIVVYTGHTGGQLEQEALETYLSDLDKKEFCVGKINFLNRGSAPYLIVIDKTV